jgi:hypothetical protein
MELKCLRGKLRKNHDPGITNDFLGKRPFSRPFNSK